MILYAHAEGQSEGESLWNVRNVMAMFDFEEAVWESKSW